MTRTVAGAFLHDLRQALGTGGVNPATEQHLRNEFRKIGWQSDAMAFTDTVDREIAQLEREAAALKALRLRHFG